MKNKFFNRFIGTIEDRDEYQLKEIYKELAFSGILLWYLILLLMFISLIIDTIHNTLNFLTIALLIVNMIYAMNITSKLRKKGLDDTDCVTIEEYKNKKKQLKKSSTITGIMWGVFMLVTMQYLLPFLSYGAIDISLPKVLLWLIAAIVFSTLIYWTSVSKIQKHF